MKTMRFDHALNMSTISGLWLHHFVKAVHFVARTSFETAFYHCASGNHDLATVLPKILCKRRVLKNFFSKQRYLCTILLEWSSFYCREWILQWTCMFWQFFLSQQRFYQITSMIKRTMWVVPKIFYQISRSQAKWDEIQTSRRKIKFLFNLFQVNMIDWLNPLIFLSQGAYYNYDSIQKCLLFTDSGQTNASIYKMNFQACTERGVTD